MEKKDNLTILGIETSCDDTCIAILKIKNYQLKILSNIVSSQVKIHRKYGGVYPALAKREHQKNLPLVFKKALRRAKLSSKKIDLIAVTIGPGLEPCLWMGINFAKALSNKLKLPIVPVNHIEAHILANWLSPGGENPKSQTLNSKDIFPAICLVVSGGHTQLILMKSYGHYKILGETRDDAAGECFDKTARILGLDYPGGPAIEAKASKFKIQNSKFKISLPRPMIYQKNYDFSFSGLKTAVLYKVKSEKRKKKEEKFIQAMCVEIQQAIIDVLIYKTLKAARNYKVKSIILGGGVTANKELRKQFRSNVKAQMSNIKFLVPDKKYCTDNAAMVAVAGYFSFKRRHTKDPEKIEANANLRL